VIVPPVATNAAVGTVVDPSLHVADTVNRVTPLGTSVEVFGEIDNLMSVGGGEATVTAEVSALVPPC
jgi:hypothetical protein